MNDDTMQADELMLLTGLEWQTILCLFKAGNFPTPIYVEPSEICWIREEIDEWAEDYSGELPDTGKYYVIWVGRKPGIYDDWAEARKHIYGKIKPKLKRFDTIAEAEQAFIDGSKMHIGF